MRADGSARLKRMHWAWTLPIVAVAMLGPSPWNTASAQTAVTFSLSGSGTGSANGFNLSGSGTVTPYGATTVNITGGSTSGSFAIAFVITFGDGSTLSASASPSLSGTTYSGTATITSGTGKFAGANGSFTFAVTVSVGSAGAFNFTEMGSGIITTSGQQTYYFSQLAFGGGYQTILTFINYSLQTVTCTTTFHGDTGSLLSVPFGQGTISTRTDTLLPGGSIHDQSVASLAAATSEGWAQATCSGPVEASLLNRYYQSGVPVGEASVNAETAPTTKFVTFAQTATGIAYGNPSPTVSTSVTITVFNTAGAQLASTTVTLGPLAHSAANLGPLLGLANFTGFVEITSTNPIISLSLNAEVFPVFSSLPPGDLPAVPPSGAQSYYFSQLAFGGGYQTILTYINYSSQTITCTTTFFGDPGSPLSVPFAQGTISTRTDTLLPGGSIHDQSVASLTAATSQGWAQASCSGPVQASLLYRYYQSGAPVGEASVNAEAVPTTKFVTFAQTATGIAYGNPSSTQSTSITFTAFNAVGTALGSKVVTLGPLAHSAANLGPLLGLSNFTGFVEITATNPIVSLSLNAEVFPVFSSLPPGDLPSSTTLVN